MRWLIIYPDGVFEARDDYREVMDALDEYPGAVVLGEEQARDLYNFLGGLFG